MTRIRKLSTALAAVALLAAASAQAASTTINADFAIGTANGMFDGTSFNFTSGAGLVSGWVMEDPMGNIYSVALNNSTSAWTTSVVFGYDTWTLAPTSLLSGAQTITINGDNGTVFHANFTYADAPAPAVPEPESYAMMVAGLGVLGAMARRRQQKK